MLYVGAHMCVNCWHNYYIFSTATVLGQNNKRPINVHIKKKTYKFSESRRMTDETTAKLVFY